MLAATVFVVAAALPLLLQLALISHARRAQRRRWDTAPEAWVEEPIAAVKRAYLRLAPDGREASLAGLTVGGRYAAEDRARCPRGCEPPGEACNCGFYAMRGDAEAAELATETRGLFGEAVSVRLDVELSGEVLEYDRGYRAERQRVLRVGVPDRCVPCARFAASAPATGLVAQPAGYLRVAGVGSPGTRIDPGLRGWLVLQPACEEHWRAAPPPNALALVDLAGMLGTEVGWERAVAEGSSGDVAA